MKFATCVLFVVPLLAATPPTLAENEPIVLEAEAGALGSAFNVTTADGVTYASINSTVGGFNPTLFPYTTLFRSDRKSVV